MTSAALPALATAQESVSIAGELGTRADSNFARDRNVAVRERPHPEYEAIGARVGTFLLLPRIDLGVEYNDNVFAADTGAAPPFNKEISDTIWTAKPEVSLESDWPRHALRLYASGEVRRYMDNDSENATDWAVGGQTLLDFAGRTTVDAGAEYAKVTERRSAINADRAAPEPVESKQLKANLGIGKEFNRLKLGASGAIHKYDFDDVGAFDQDYRDFTSSAVSLRGDYAISPATAVFLEGTANNRDYRVSNTRDSSGWQVLTGANFELGALTRGEVAVGYLQQSYDTAGLSDVSGFGYRAKVEWFPTQLTTVTLSAQRTIEEAGPAGVAGYLFNDFSAQVDHELMRNVILTGKVAYQTADFEQANRDDKRFEVSGNATWLINRRVGINVAASHLSQSSNIGPEFDVNKVTAAFIVQF